MNKYLLLISLLFISAFTHEVKANETIRIPIERDTFVQERFPQISPYNKQIISIGYEGDYPWKKTRGFFNYDLSKIPKGELIRAQFKIYQKKSMQREDYKIQVYKPNRIWDQRFVNWVGQPKSEPTSVIALIDKYSGWKSVNILTLIESQLSENTWKNGVALRAVSEEEPGGYFWSSDCVDGSTHIACSEGQTPYLELEIEIEEENEGDNLVEEKNLNESISELRETIPIPEIILIPDTEKKELRAKVIAPVGYQARIFNLAGLQMVTETGKEVVLVSHWVPAIKYTYYAKIQTKTGLTSMKSQLKTYRSPEETQGEESMLAKYSPKESKSVNKSLCNVEYNTEKSKIEKFECNLEAPTLTGSKNIHPVGSHYWINTFGTVSDIVRVTINYYGCQEKKITSPRTWFGCQKELIEVEEKDINSHGTFITHFKDRDISEYNVQRNNDAYHLLVAVGSNYSSSVVRNSKEVSFSLRIKDQWFNYVNRTAKSSKWKLDIAETVQPLSLYEKYFSFPFKKFIGVTQWHGKTAYDNNHSGIDFGSYKEKLYAMSDGYIQHIGWDSNNGKCLSGGNFLEIRHNNGMHSAYLHLEDYKKEDGTKWKKGQKVSNGDLLGTSGNSGSYNCMQLGYHLHLEVRRDQYQKNHINPVEWIEVDWDKIPTIDFQTYPGRLTGENPHPGI